MHDETDLLGITGAIVDCALRIHRDLGPGLLESVYEQVLEVALRKRGLRVRRQVSVQFTYDGVECKDGFRVDLLVEDCVVVELKAASRLDAVHARQVLSYLRILNLRAGLLINFGAPLLKDGLNRIVNRRVNHTGQLSGIVRMESSGA